MVCDGNGHDIWCNGPGGTVINITDIQVKRNGVVLDWLATVYRGETLTIEGKVHGQSWPCANFRLDYYAGFAGDWYIGCYADRISDQTDWWVPMEWRVPDDVPNGPLILDIFNYHNAGDVESWYITIASSSCDTYTTKATCEAAGCYWYNGACHESPPSCFAINTETECLNYGCFWWNGRCNASQPSCSDLNNQADCTRYGCYWYNNSCHEYQECEQYTNMTACVAAGCWWYFDSCHSSPPPNCEDITTKSMCETYGCFWWNDSCHASQPSCSDLNNQADCTRYGCYWYNNSCHSSPQPMECEEYITQATCEAADCYWYNGACHSTPSPSECKSITTETECIATGCHWYAYPNPFGEPSCHSKEMLMSYLPFVVAGVGGTIILVALLTPSKKHAPEPRKIQEL